jgi:hypothetical protein
MKMKKLLLGAALSLAFGSMSSAYAAGTISFDPDGAGAGGAISVNTFDWSPDNGLVLATGNPSATSNYQVVAQGKLGTFIAPGNVNIPVSTGEFTFQASFFEHATNLASGAAVLTTGVGASSFNVYFNPAAGTANQITGAGYNAGTLILHGTLVSLTGNFTNLSQLDRVAGNVDANGNSLNFPPVLLDQVGADNQNGTLSDQGNGSTTIKIDVSFADPNFFKSNITSLLIDLQDTSNAAIPFITANPSDQVVGFTPEYALNNIGQRVDGFVASSGPNNGLCPNGSQTETGAAGTRCDTHLQTDASTSFNPVPEPGSLALLGGALAAISLIRGRKRTA